MRVPLIAGNWKMNTTIAEATRLVKEMRQGLDEVEGVDKVICPPFVSLAAVKELIKGSSIKLGAQNLYFEEGGAYTGEISPLMLAEICDFVIIGHSERRQNFHETNEIVNRKLRAALKCGLKPILCIGEKLEENEAGRTEEVIAEQLRLSLPGLEFFAELELAATKSSIYDVVIAYEPVWAIGTGKAASGKQADEIIGLIRHHLAKLYGRRVAQSARILYGGSVTTDNIAEFMQQTEIDGALVGGASLRANQFVGIVQQTSAIKGR